jgi:hypothetical protein
LNPGKPAAAQVEALDDLARILSLCGIREGLYHRRYERDESSSNGEKSSIPTSAVRYRESLKSLYVAILKFPATFVCFLSQGIGPRFALNTVGWTKWDDLFNDVGDKASKFENIVLQLKDEQYDDECHAKRERYEKLTKLAAIEEEVARIDKMIDMNRRDGQFIGLLRWLSSVDPSINYNSARESHLPLTGDWLVLRNEEFRKWIHTENSLLWLNGKRESPMLRY